MVLPLQVYDNKKLYDDSDDLSHPENNQSPGSGNNDSLELRAAEESANSTSQPGNSTSNKEEKLGLGFTSNIPSGGKKKGGWSKKKTALLLGGGLGLGLVIVIMVVMLSLSSLKAVHFATVLRSVGFARFNMYMNRQFGQTLFDAATLTDTSTGKVPLGKRSLVDRLRGVNPERQLTQLGNENKLRFEFETESKWGGLKKTNNFRGVRVSAEGTNLKSISLDDVSQRLTGKNFNDLGLLDYRAKAQVKAAFVDDVMKNGLGETLALKGRMARSSIYDGLRQATGIKLKKWKKAAKEYKGASAEEARNKNIDEGLTDIDKNGEAKPGSGLNDVDEAAEQEAKAAEESAKKGTKQVKELSPKLKAVNSVAQDISAGVFVATVACVVHDLDNSFKSMAKPREQQVARFGHSAQTTADQIKKGDVAAEAVGAEATRWGSANSAYFYKVSTGQKVTEQDRKQLSEVATVTPPSSGFGDVIGIVNEVMEMSLGGPFVAILENVPVIGDVVGGTKKKLIDVGCNAVLNEFVQYGVAGAEIGLAVFTAGSSEGIAQGIITGLKASAKFAGTVAIGELMGQMIQSAVDTYAGTDFSATNSNEQLYNNQAVATDYLQQTGTRRISYGRKLTPQETQESQTLALNELRNRYNQGSFSERYFAIDNPFSLVGKMSAIVPQNLSGIARSSQRSLLSVMSSGASLIQNFTDPLSQLFFGSKLAYAAPNSTDYGSFGVDEFGWSNAELQRIEYDESFSLDNLTNFVEPQLDTLNQKYEKCYTYTLQVEKPGDCDDLGSEEALRWRAYMAKSYAADELGKDLEVDESVNQSGGGEFVAGDTSHLTCDAGSDAGIGDGYKNGQLFKIRLCNVQGMIVNAQIAKKLDDMVNAARSAGINLSASQAFRTMAEQEYFYNCYVTKSCNNGNKAAKPGYSNHQMGVALDFRCNGGSMTYGNVCFNWLSANSAAYGFSNKVQGEAWHWSIDGH